MRAAVLLWLLVSTGIGLCGHGHAQSPSPLLPTPVTGEARMVTFDFDDDRIYKVLVRPRNTTQLKLAADEKVIYVSAGDSSNFNVSVPASKAFVEVKPKWEGISTNLLVVTTRRSYHIDLQSTAEGKKWYTRVAWAYGDNALLDITRSQEALSSAPSAPSAPSATRPTPWGSPSSAHTGVIPQDLVGNGVSLDKLYFQYEVDGEAPFRPVQVFDDGTHTYIRLADDLQELPALFMLPPGEDDMALVNYSVAPPYLVVQRTMDKFLLKLGKAKITVVRESSKRGFFERFGLGRRGGR